MSSLSLAVPWGGDPTVLGWLTVLVYLAAALLAFRVSRRFDGSAASERQFYVAVALLTLFLGVNKQADFQTTAVRALRSLLWGTEYWAQRRVIVGAAVVVVLAAGAAVGVTLLRLVLGAPRATERVLVGLFMLFAFIAFRALLFAKLSFVGASDLLRGFELLGLFVILSGSFLRLRSLAGATGKARAG